jgi:hypothetical protein
MKSIPDVFMVCIAAVLFVATTVSAVELSDEQVDNLVRRSYQYVAMYNVNNKFALKNGPGNVDHILWITMKKGKPVISMITLDGIWDRKGRDLELLKKYERTVKSEG